jgi:mRNA-degrading endonuclease RelE of RelBE toxin-antitoxin system
MSGRRYQVFIAPYAHRRYKKFDSGLQQKIKEEAKKLSEDPHIYKDL